MPDPIEPVVSATETPTPLTPETKTETPAPLIAPTATATFIPDPAKSDAENAAAKADFDKAHPSAEGAKPPEFVPLTAADYTIPEGFIPLSEELSGEFLGLANELKLPKEGVQKLVDLQAKVMREASERGSTQFAELQTTLQNEVKADPEIGGDKLAPNLTKIEGLLTRFGDDKVREVFHITNAGNYLPMVRFMAKIADAIGEAGPVGGNPGGGTENTEDARAKRLYPSMTK